MGTNNQEHSRIIIEGYGKDGVIEANNMELL